MKILNWIRDWRDRQRRDRESAAWCKTVYSPEVKIALKESMQRLSDNIADELKRDLDGKQ